MFYFLIALPLIWDACGFMDIFIYILLYQLNHLTGIIKLS